MAADDLDDLFAEARAAQIQASTGLMARVLADAAAAQPRRVPAPRPRFTLAALVTALGGLGGMAGLATAAVAGLWVGLAPPAAVDDMAALLLGGAEDLILIPDLEGLVSDADG